MNRIVGALIVVFNITGKASSELPTGNTLPAIMRACACTLGEFTDVSGKEKVEVDTTIHIVGDHTIYA